MQGCTGANLPQQEFGIFRELVRGSRGCDDQGQLRGNQHAVDGRYEDARRSYRTALVFNPSCVSAHLGLGYLAFCEEKWETSLLHYRKALEIDPTSADAHYGAARVLLEINRVDDALHATRATLQIDPTYDDARDTLTALSKPA